MAARTESTTLMEMKGVGRGPDFLGDLSDGCMGIENTADGILSNFGTVTDAGHRKVGIKSTRSSD